MQQDLWGIARFARFTLRYPAAAARALLDLRLPPAASWSALALTCLLSAILFHLSIGLLTTAEQQDLAGFIGSPFGTVTISAVALLFLVFAVHLFGRAFGGRGRLDDAALLVAWLQGIFLFLQAAQILFLLILPVVSDIIGTFGMALFLWLLAPFVMVLHGFSSVWKVLFGILGTAFLLALAASVLIVLLSGV